MTLSHHVFNHRVINFSLGLQHFQNMVTEKSGEISGIRGVANGKRTIRKETAISTDNVQMGVEILKIPKRLNSDHGTGYGPVRGDLLVLDDWGLDTFSKEQQHDLLEILEDRHGRRSTLITSQLPVQHWHDILGDPTLADAILDRLVHNAHKIDLKGDSMRKKKSLNKKNPE